MKFKTIDRLSCDRISLVDRYIIDQLSLFFWFSVGLFSALGVTIGTVSDLGYKVTEYNLPVSVACLIFAYKIPEYVAYALPISVLLACLIIYGRLNSNCELTALLSFGISIQRIIAPALLCSLLIVGLTFVLNEVVVPAANYRANLLQNPFIAKTELNLQKKDIFYPEYQLSASNTSSKSLSRIYFAEQYRDRVLEKVTIISLERGNISEIVTAGLARWDGEKQLWSLRKGELNQIDRDSGKINVKEFEFLQLSFPDTLFKIARLQRSPEDMNIRQAKRYLSLIQDSGRTTDIAKFAVRIQQKYAFPVICLVFAAIGTALGVKYSQVNISKAFGLCVGIVFLYYFLGFSFGSLGITGTISPFWAAWIPNILGAIAGIAILAK